MAHINSSIAQRYRTRTLSTPELLRVDEHVAACRFCRHSLLGPRHPDDAIRSVVENLEDGDESHIEHETIERFVDERVSGREREAIEGHLAYCAQCRSDLADLRAFAADVRSLDESNIVDFTIARRAPARMRYFAAAAAVTVATVGGLLAVRAQHDAKPATHAQVATANKVGNSNAEADALVRAALTNGIKTPASLRDLAGTQSTLMGIPDVQTFAPAAPLATFVRSTRPRFSWTPLPGTALYRVEVYDEAGNDVAASTWRSTSSWTVNRDLPAGHIYQWQVVSDDGSIAPGPAAPVAKFATLSVASAARVSAAEARYRVSSPAALAVLYAHEGLLDEAHATLAKAPRAPDIVELQKRIDAIRH
jgi:hypothetical protein